MVLYGAEGLALRHLVPSQTHAELFYDVIQTVGGWTCTCPDYKYRKRECKHIKSVKRIGIGIKEV